MALEHEIATNRATKSRLHLKSAKWRCELLGTLKCVWEWVVEGKFWEGNQEKILENKNKGHNGTVQTANTLA